MEFPKQVMTIKELEKMGFSAKKLREIAQKNGFPISFREGGMTSPIKFDTTLLYQHIKKQSKKYER